ncbi:hypothetical protein, partial [Ligilactobacillus ruminis]|uniref:hypothetical protein n=1 Tax=Ligilactobacillus ruminis TaxID=1623 RepID=UPI003F9949FF
FILLVFLVFLVNLNYTWEMSTWLSFFYQFTPLYGHNPFASACADFGRISRQNSDTLLGFCLLLPPRAPISVGAVDKIQAF